MTQKKSKTVGIPDKLIDAIRKRLAEGKRVRRALPLDGRLHIDRTLPFLVVYRRPPKRPDSGTERLVMGEASYLIASGGRRLQASLSKFIRDIVETLAGECGAFLLIEIWSKPESQRNSEMGEVVAKPGLRIVTAPVRLPTKSVEALEKSLKRIRILKQKATVEVSTNKKLSLAGFPPLIPAAEVRKLNCFMIGLEVDPIYRNPVSGEIFPLVLRALHRGLATALKRATFEFSRHQTSLRPPHYQALGRRAVVKAVWEVDRRLAEISQSFDFLLQVTPVNTGSAWLKFQQSHFERAPVLYYRPLPVDPAHLKEQLYAIPISRVEDPTLAFLFREKRLELDRQLTMLWDRGRPAFLYGSMQLFGGVSRDLANLANDILRKLPPHSRDDTAKNAVNAVAFADRAKGEIEFYRQTYPELSSRVEIRDDITGLMVSQGNLLIGKQTKVPQTRVNALIAHEVGTHVVTYFNGRAQPFRQLYCGLAGYEELQEGLAVLAEFFVGGLSRPRLRLLAARVVATHCLIDGATFVETFRELNRVYGFEQRTAFAITVRIYRSGGLTKDAVYLRGLLEVLDYLKEGGELESLFVGKISAEHISIIRELQYRKVLQPAPLQPRYLRNSQTAEKISRLKNGMSPLNLIERRG